MLLKALDPAQAPQPLLADSLSWVASRRRQGGWSERPGPALRAGSATLYLDEQVMSPLGQSSPLRNGGKGHQSLRGLWALNMIK